MYIYIFCYIYTFQVFSANNVELVTKTRTEHLTEADKLRHRTARSPLQSLLGIIEVEEKATSPVVNGVCVNFFKIQLAFLLLGSKA